MTKAPVITIDGPTASGKGTIAQLVAKQLGWRVLDSGALYRLTALALVKSGWSDSFTETKAAQCAASLKIEFIDGEVFLAQENVTAAIRQENIGNLASRVAALAQVRSALLDLQRNFRQAPGLVGDGRDMGTVIFPDAELKIYLDADVQIRAERRYKQLNEKGISANITDLLNDLILRDKRDKERLHAPLKPAADAVIIDSSHLGINTVVEQIIKLWGQRAA